MTKELKLVKSKNKATAKASRVKAKEKKAEKEINYSEYGYRPDDNIEIKGSHLLALINLFHKLAQEEVEIYFPLNEQGAILDRSKPEVRMKPKGVAFQDEAYNLFDLHVKNVREGKATKLSVIEEELKNLAKKAEDSFKEATDNLEIVKEAVDSEQ